MILEKRDEFYKKKGIDFGFLYKDYNLRRVPFIRPYIIEKNTLDKYCDCCRKCL